jgi:hypothetical protein
MDLLVDRIDLLAQFLQGRRGRGCLGHLRKPWCRNSPMQPADSRID